MNKRSIIDGSFANGVENYWADHFGFRDFLIKVNNTINLKVFNKAPTQEIILGKDNWLFLTNEQPDFEKKSMHSEEIELVVKKLENFAQALERKNIEFFFFVSPNKSTIYPEYLSDSILKPEPGQKSNLELLNDLLTNSQSLHYLDLRPVLFEQKQNYRMYPANDSHWTYTGTFFVFQELLSALAEITDIPATSPTIDFEQYKLIDEIHGGEGDIEKLLGSFQATQASEVGQLEITFPDNINQFPKILWYQTSFSDKLKPFLEPYCSQIEYFHFQGQPMKITLEPNLLGTKIVVFELTERWLTELIDYKFPDLP